MVRTFVPKCLLGGIYLCLIVPILKIFLPSVVFRERKIENEADFRDFFEMSKAKLAIFY
jgi:hypothetical protein